MSDNDNLRTYSRLELADPGILHSTAEILLKRHPIPVGFSLTTTIPEEHALILAPSGGPKMSMLSFLLNVLWIVTGGLWMAVAGLVAAGLMAITLIGLPWARAAFTIASYTLLPFGRVALPRDEVDDGHKDMGTGPLGAVGNVIWLILAGWWLALGHVITALDLALTLIGLPFAWVHLKLATLSLWPVGKSIVTIEEAGLRRGRTRRAQGDTR